MAARHPNVNVANKYARDVISGKIPACEWVVLACERHVLDLKREKNKTAKYEFDRDLAERSCQFIQLLPHTKGRWARKSERIALSGWQMFVVASVFGWVDKYTRLRKYVEIYLEVPRKNGKSTMMSGIGLLCLCDPFEFGAEVYSGATSEKQAWEVFRPARLMCKRTPELTEAYGIDVNAGSLIIPEDGSRFEPVIGNPGDGSSPSCVLIDEFHEHDKPDLYDTMSTGTGAREQPLLFVITTAGINTAGPCYEMRLKAQKILQGTMNDDRFFSLIYTIDEGDDWTAPLSLKKANPNMGVSVMPDYLKARITQAINSPGKQSIIKTKHLNLWTGARNQWLNMERWKKCGNPDLAIEQFVKCPSVVALDLATRVDIAAVVVLFFRVEDDGRRHFYAFPYFWLPDDAMQDSKNAQRFSGWAAEGLINIMEGAEIDLNEIQSFIIGSRENQELGLSSLYQINELVYDPWQAAQMAQSATAEGATAVEFRNTVQNMSPAMKELEGAVNSGRFHHDGNPILAWMASNVVARMDAKENIFPRKDLPENKIDGMIATIMAMGRAHESIDSGHAYQSRGFVQI